jgi:hypothetical protein
VEINLLNCDSVPPLTPSSLRPQRAVPPSEIVATATDEEDPAEIEASKFRPAYISLTANIVACHRCRSGYATGHHQFVLLKPANLSSWAAVQFPEKVTEAR